MKTQALRYEERLGQENLLPLIFRMALPAITAQFVNLLYNMVDRIYIGHIAVVGKTALTGTDYEPWHYRYVGKEAALEICNLELTLEEYLG